MRIKLRFSVVFCFLIISFLHTSSYSQKKNSSYISDSIQFWAIIKEHSAVLNRNPDSALFILQKGLIYTQKPQNIRLKGYYNMFLGGIYNAKLQATDAYTHYSRAYQIFTSLGDKYYCALLKANLGICYMLKGQYPIAKENLMYALRYFESIADSERINAACINLSFISNDLKEDSEMENYLFKGLKYTNQDYKKGKIYNNLGELYERRREFAKSLNSYKKAYYYCSKASDLVTISMIFHNTGRIYMLQHKNDSALFYFKKSILLNKSSSSNYLSSLVYRDMATIFKEAGTSDKVMEYINKSISMAQEDNMAKVLADDYKWLAEWYSSKHSFEKAYYYHVQSTLINDSLFNETKNRQTKEMEAIYQNEKKQSEINLLSEQNKVASLKLRNNRILLISIGILLIFIFGFSVLIIRQNKLKADNKSLELEHKLLRSQMNPHFIFNALAAIQNQVLNKPAIEAAGYLSGFAKLMRSILYSSRNETIPLSQEVETLEEYLKLQKLRLKERLNYQFTYQLIDDISEIAIPPMLLQPFIENAVEHGIAKKEVQEGNIWISFTEDNNKLTITIEDDGIGLQQTSQNSASDHISLATRITQERIQALSKTFKSKIHFSIENRVSNHGEITGAKVFLQLPLLFVTN